VTLRPGDPGRTLTPVVDAYDMAARLADIVATPRLQQLIAGAPKAPLVLGGSTPR
jgi:hypothetical protein